MRYEVKGDWILCELAVKDRMEDDLGIDCEAEWVRVAIHIPSIKIFRETDTRENCSTLDGYDGLQFTITVPFDDLLKIVFDE